MAFLSTLPEDHRKDHEYRLTLQCSLSRPGPGRAEMGSAPFPSTPSCTFSNQVTLYQLFGCLGTTVTKHPKLSAFNDRNSSAHDSGAGRPRSMCQQVPFEAVRENCSRSPNPLLLVACWQFLAFLDWEKQHWDSAFIFSWPLPGSACVQSSLFVRTQLSWIRIHLKDPILT